MDQTKQIDLATRALVACVILGIVGNLLLRDAPWGVGFTLYGLSILGGCSYLFRYRSQPVSREITRLVAPAILFLGLFSWRDADALKFLNALALFLVVGLATLRARTGRIAFGSVLDYPFRLVGSLFSFIPDFVMLARLEGRWHQFGEKMSNAKAIVRGIFIAAPIVLIFAGLLASADSRFENLLSGPAHADPNAMWSNICISVVCTWLVGGLFRRLFLAQDHVFYGPPKANDNALGITEVAIILGSINALFAVFVVLQIPYLFGGVHLVQVTAHLSFGDYARRGFFELVSVGVLALSLLLALHSAVRKETRAQERIYNWMATATVILLFVMLASAMQRMAIYVDSYGMSQLRLYVSAALAWITLVFGWFLATVVRGRHPRFAFGALTLFLIGVVTLNIANPDAMVARINTGRAPNKIDTETLVDLSADATPALVAALPNLTPEARRKIEAGLSREKDSLDHADWRSWNLGVENASLALKTVLLPPVVASNAEPLPTGP